MIKIDNISFSYGKEKVLDRLNLEVAPGEIIAVLGASGSGKSTLLNILAGLLKPLTGSVKEKINTALVFQDYALFPNLSVLDNLKFVSKDQKAIDFWISKMNLKAEQDKKPNNLSGGQKQRVAVARALLCKPELLLMDEPFSNLDTAHKSKLRLTLKSLLKEQNQSTLIVTHDLEDAFSLADKIAILHQGKMVQCDSPEKIYQTPINKEVLKLSGPYTAVPLQDKLHYCRPEKLSLGEGENTFIAKVTGTQFSGVFYKVYFQSQAAEGYFYHSSPINDDEVVLNINSKDLISF